MRARPGRWVTFLLLAQAQLRLSPSPHFLLLLLFHLRRVTLDPLSSHPLLPRWSPSLSSPLLPRRCRSRPLRPRAALSSVPTPRLARLAPQCTSSSRVARTRPRVKVRPPSARLDLACAKRESPLYRSYAGVLGQIATMVKSQLPGSTSEGIVCAPVLSPSPSLPAARLRPSPTSSNRGTLTHGRCDTDPATLIPYASSEAAGVSAMTNAIQSYTARCPSSRLVLMGYSQVRHPVTLTPAPSTHADSRAGSTGSPCAWRCAVRLVRSLWPFKRGLQRHRGT